MELLLVLVLALGVLTTYLVNKLGKISDIAEDQCEIIESLLEELERLGSPNVIRFPRNDDGRQGTADEASDRKGDEPRF